MKRFCKKENLGITLIALVITIIVLLILAGIAVAQLSGNNLFENAKLAKEKYKKSRELEDEIIGDYEDAITGDRGNKLNFSTEEQVVGTWIDGKNLYQKTINCGQLANKSSITIPHGVQNLKYVSKIEGIITDGNGWYSPLSYTHDTSKDCDISVCVSGANIIISGRNANNSHLTAIVSMQYTKTTD